jgi:hypothetical protein
MMLKKIRLFLFGLFVVNAVIGQEMTHQEGVSFLEAALVKTEIGVASSFAYGKNITDDIYLKARGFAEFGRITGFKYTQYGTDIMAYVKPFDIINGVQLNVGAGATVGYERLNVSKELQKGIGFQAGIKAGAEGEIFLKNDLAFFFFGNQAYMIKPSIGKKYYEFGVGLRLFLDYY